MAKFSAKNRGRRVRSSLGAVLRRLRAVADQPAGEHAIGDQRDAELAQRRQNLALDAAREQRIFDLQAPRSDARRRAPDRLGGGFGEADVAHIAGLHHVGDGADGVLDRHLRVDARRLIEIDIIGAEPAQRIAEKILDRLRPRVVADDLAVGAAQRAAFDHDEGAIALAAFERVADQHFVVAHAVEIAGVDEGDAGLERRMDGGDGFGVFRRSVNARHAHAAESEGGDERAVTAEFYLLHCKSYRLSSSAKADDPVLTIYP